MEIVLYILIALVVGAGIGGFITFRRAATKVNFLMDAMEDGEMNFRFKETNRLNKALNRQKTILEKHRQENEAESWSKLIRVLTHEIMNTVTPIAALSESLAQDDTLDTKAGLETIAQSSRDLINFVNSYRSLSKIAKPVKRPIMVDELIAKVIELTSTETEQHGARCTYRALSPDILLYADEGQISQILINLIKNAFQAESTLIEITAELSPKEEVMIKISDDGLPISHESKDQIFIPFYTTKAGGSGIGLSLSRQIMRLHNGTLDLLQSDNERTTFMMKFN